MNKNHNLTDQWKEHELKNILTKAWPTFQLTAMATILIISLTIAFPSLLLWSTDTAPVSAYYLIFQGAFGSWNKMIQVLNVWVPLTLCSTGLIYTFRISLWNIGIEGQVIMGAIFSTAILRHQYVLYSPILALPLAIIAAIIGGGCWGIINGFLKTKGGVNEIMSGLGMNFLAQGLTLWLIFGPWKRPGMASMSGTELLPPFFRLPTFFDFHLSPYGILFTLISISFTVLFLRYTYTGLALKAIGKNPKASFLLGLQPARYMLLAMAFSGGIAGLAGCVQVTGVYHRLIPAISSNYGYLALLVVMLANYRVRTIPLIAFFFAALNVGSIQLPMMLQIDSSFSGVIQGIFVFGALCFYAWRTSNQTSHSRILS